MEVGGSVYLQAQIDWSQATRIPAADRARLAREFTRLSRDAAFDVAPDFSSAFRDCEEFKDCLRSAQREVGELERAIAQVGGQSIAPRVDVSELERAVNLSQQLRANSDIRVNISEKRDRRTSNQPAEIGRAVHDALKEEFSETRKSVEKSGRGGGIGRLVTAPLSGAFRGFTEGIGINFASEFSKGILGNGLGKRLQQLGDVAEGYVSERSQQVGEAVARSVGYYEGLQSVRRDLEAVGRAVDDFLDPAKFGEKIGNLEGRLVSFLDNAFVAKDSAAATQDLVDAIAPAQELSQQLAVRLSGATIRALAQPFRIRKKALLRRSGEIAEALSEQIEVPELQEGKKGVILATGGVPLEKEEAGGRNTHLIQQSLRQTFPESQVVPVTNPWSSDPETIGQLYEMRNAAINAVLNSGILSEAEVAKIVASQDDKSRSIFDPLNVEKMLQVALELGFNIDSIVLDAFRRAYESKYPELEGAITFFGNSFGSAIVEEATAIAEKAGADVKGIGLLFPQLDLTATASPENYKAIVGSLDHTAVQLFGANPEVLRPDELTKRNRKLYERGLSSARKSAFNPESFSGLLTPGPATEVFPNAGFAHSFSRALANPEINQSIQEFTGGRLGQVPEGALGEVGEKMGSYLFDLYIQLESLDRSFRVALGEAEALAEFTREGYSFVQPESLELTKTFGPSQEQPDLFHAVEENFKRSFDDIAKKYGPEAAEPIKRVSQAVDESIAELVLAIGKFHETGVRDNEAITAAYQKFADATGISDRPVTSVEDLQAIALERLGSELKTPTAVTKSQEISAAAASQPPATFVPPELAADLDEEQRQAIEQSQAHIREWAEGILDLWEDARTQAIQAGEQAARQANLPEQPIQGVVGDVQEIAGKAGAASPPRKGEPARGRTYRANPRSRWGTG